MTGRSPLLTIVLACCLILQGMLAWVMPIQSGMAMAGELEQIEQAHEPAPSKPPCHQASVPPGTDPAPVAHGEEPCCDLPASTCTSLCYWACAFTSAPPLAGTSLSVALLPGTPILFLSSIFPPWVPPVPTPPPIQTTTVLA